MGIIRNICTLLSAKPEIMYDGRVQLILIITFLFFVQGILNNYFSPNFESPRTASLRSVTPNQLVVEAESANDCEGERHVPATHAPFFFQAIPINSADKEMLMTVKGIGPTLAESIIAYRQNSGPFKSVEDLTKIPGVGTKRAASLAPFLLLGEVP